MNYLTILAKQTLFLAFLITSSVYSYATTGIGKILDVQDDARLYCDSECELNFFIRINIANPANANLDEILPMYLNYDLGGEMTETHPVDLTKFFDYNNTINDTPILEYRLYFSIDVSSGNQDELPTDYSLSLFTDNPRANNGNLVPYPVQMYKAENSFFPCDVFNLSFGQQVPAPGCDINENYDPFYAGDFNLHCKQCFDTPEPGNPKNNEPYIITSKIPLIVDPFNGNNNSFQSNDNNLSGLQIYPNPFSTQLRVPFELKEAAQVDFQVFDATGKIIYKESNLQDAGLHQIELNTDVWPAGVYYAKTQSGDAIQSYRLVKID